jgi:hypothetical protein
VTSSNTDKGLEEKKELENSLKLHGDERNWLNKEDFRHGLRKTKNSGSSSLD